ncbi:DMT family transporter [Pseudomonas sp. PB105]|uniref:DMT family transporter n=1 Tax=Pseudomonas TaxID=286 RepID=UPI00131EA9EB|nr:MULTISPECIES: DMT family transporter [Pseudomonas]KAE9655088.1 DMT family transporter [Pseudomonas sp. PB105]MBD8236552.1 DMT family transporter [Pseudomonas fluorescens]MDY0894653.1 DMT family transporter [Pseudomonas fluorescens]MVW95630.1 DMT family transporter [Pseudomonas sp. PB100]
MNPIAHKSYEVRLTSPLPIAFILLWSSGYIGGAFGVRYGEPFTMTFYRFALAALVFLGVAIAIKAEWPRRLTPYLHAAVVGLLLQALQFGGLYTGISQGVPAGQAALIVGLMPVFVVIGAYFCLGEQLSWRDLPGSILGVGGVAIVVGNSFLGTASSISGYGAVGLALLGITLGTLYQKRFLGGVDLWVGCFIQMATASLVMLALACATETMQVTEWMPFAASVAWITLMNSVGALTLLYLMIRRGDASKATNLFHVIPAVTQIMASMVLGEMPSGVAILGFVVSGAGVYWMNHGRTR